jgi:hypothetical protein
MSLRALGLDIEAVVFDLDGVHFAPGHGTPPLRQAVATVRDHRDLLLRLGLAPLADTDGKGRA